MIPTLQLAQFGRAGKAATVGADPYFANVKLLLHFDGTDGSTTFTDVRGHTCTANANAQIDTAQAKFGGASGLFDGVGDYVRVAGSPDFYFGAGDFTLECFVRPVSLTGNRFIASPRRVSGADYNWIWLVYEGTIYFTAYGPSAGTTLVSLVGGTLTTGGAFQHVGVTRSGNTWRLLHDGAVVDTETAAGSVYDAAENLLIGADAAYSGREWDGHIDEFRLTVGAARYTGAYTVPTAAFPNS